MFIPWLEEWGLSVLHTCRVKAHLQSLTLPLYDVDIKFQLSDHLPPNVRVLDQLRQMARVLLDLVQELGVQVSVSGHFVIKAGLYLFRRLRLSWDTVIQSVYFAQKRYFVGLTTKSVLGIFGWLSMGFISIDPAEFLCFGTKNPD